MPIEPAPSAFVASPFLQHVATALFAAAVLHTFLAGRIATLSKRYPEESAQANLLHFLGEVEVVFGLWAAALVAVIASQHGTPSAISYLESVNFTEAAFVFVIMCMAATKPVIQIAGDLLSAFARILPLAPRASFYLSALTLGPLLGSFITEPAAMTVIALLLKEHFFDREMSVRFKYATTGLLFVNVSIGGTLTHFAAPPVLMVAGPWGWDVRHMLLQFGWKAALAVAVSALFTIFAFRNELRVDPRPAVSSGQSETPELGTRRAPAWLVASHLAFMGLCVAYHAHISFFLPLFLLFLGWCEVTKEHQSILKIRESLLVGFFLGGLVVLGGLQGWWLRPLVGGLDALPLFFGATALTAVTDNAALTYLGTLVPDLSEAAKYALVSGAVAGGGLTVIANAPNPAGYGILAPSFGEGGIDPVRLFLAAVPYTILSMVALYLL